MRAFLLAVALLVLAVPSRGQTHIKSLSFLPGSSTLGPHDGLVVADFLWSGVAYRGLICDSHERNIKNPQDICYALGYTQKGSKTVWKGALSSLNNVPTIRIDNYNCIKAGTDPLYLASCSFARQVTCPDYQLLAVICTERRGVSTTPPPTLPTLPPVNCSVGASSNVRLLDSSNKAVVTTGRVEVKSGTTWHTVCNYDFQNKQASLVCAMLCSSGADPKALSGPNTGVSPDVTVTCPSTATDLSACSVDQISTKPATVQQQCKEKDVAYVQCTPPTAQPPVSPDPVGEVSCKDNLATVTFNKTLNPGLSENHLVMYNSGTAQSNCFFNVTDTGGNIVAIFTLTLCGGVVEFNANETIFKNTLLRMFFPVNGLLTQANITFGVHCTLKKTVDVNTDNVNGKTQVGKSLGGTDSPSVSMKLHLDAQMTNEMQPGQEIKVQPSTRIYVKIKETSNIDETRMALRSCWLTAVKDRSSSTKLDLIIDGCKHPTYVKQLVNVDAMTQTFVFQPILFPGYKSFYLHCNTKTCAKSDMSAACSRSCTNTNAFKGRRRRKRSVDISELLKALAARGISPGEQTIDRGPFFDSSRLIAGSGVLHGSVLLLLGACLLALSF